MANKVNVLRNEIRGAEPAERKKKVKSRSTGLGGNKESWQKAGRITGLLMLSFSTALAVSMISFLFSWEVDQDLVKSLDWETLKAANPGMTSNFMGLAGAWSSHLIIYKGFGISGFIIPVYMFMTGLRLFFRAKVASLLKVFSYSVGGMMFFSILSGLITDKIGFLTGTTIDWLAGAVGFETEQWIAGVAGSLGVVLLLTGVVVGYMIVALNINFKLPTLQFGSKKEQLVYTGFENGNLANEISDKLDTAAVNSKTMATMEDEVEADEDLDEIKFILKNTEDGETTEEKTPIAQPQTAQTSGVSFEIKTTPAPKPAPLVAEMDEEATVNKSSWYRYPETSLLRNHESSNAKVNPYELEASKNLIVETLENYKIKIDKIEATIGPTVTLYEIIPAAGIRISKIKSLEDDIALSLAALGIRIIAPMPGKGTIGIEVPNQNPEIVALKEALSSPAFKNTTFDLPIVLGKTISNEVFIADLTKMPHLLMAGATGQGKSVGINTIIASILYKKHPEDVKFVLVDPKKVELSLFKNIEKHFLPELPDGQEAIITDTEMVVDVLKSLCVEMDDRYDKLKDAQVRNIKEYNKKIERGMLNSIAHKKLPYIILVIDELADLMMTAGKEVELPIARLAQLARAIGIHLIVATQRPSVNIITGIIKANFPARIAFRVTSRIDSRTILDTGGAEQLIGRGDMLFSTGNDIIRLQCPFIDTDEVEKVTHFIMEQPYPEPFRLNIITDDDEARDVDDYGDELDPMFEDAARLIVATQQGSTSMLQRKLKLGYNRAGRLMDQLEKMKIVGKNEGSKAREVLYSDENALEQFLNDLMTKANR
jgi:S-DNA-T family DNA segregation ATPase FtsK/SpoIIIE